MILTLFLFNRFGYLNQSGNFRIKVETFHYTHMHSLVRVPPSGDREIVHAL